MPIFLNVLKFISLLKSVAGTKHSVAGVKKKKTYTEPNTFSKLDIPTDGDI